MSAVTEPIEDESVVEYATKIRGYDVSCILRHGQLTGDSELIARISRAALDRDIDDPVALAQVVRDAVGSDVTIRFADSGGALHVW